VSEECDTLIVCSSTLLRVMEWQRSNPAQGGSIIKENEYEQQHFSQSIVAELDERNHRWHHLRRGIPSQHHFLGGLREKKCLSKAR
jgi:hypothetical protein